MIISFTGCDGAGKTTHIDLLKKEYATVANYRGLICLILQMEY